MDPFVIIKALNVAVLVIIGSALYVISRSTDSKPWLRHWAAYEFALAVAVLVDSNMLAVSCAAGLAAPVLLLGIIGYRRQQPPPRYTFILLFLAIALPAYGLSETVGRTAGFLYLGLAVSAAYLAAAALFFNEGGALNYFIAAVFIGRILNSLLYSLWESMGIEFIYYASDLILALMAGIGLLMAGFTRAYGELLDRERDLAFSNRKGEEMMLRLKRRNDEYHQARQTAEDASTAKTQFLANMSHELRTPLNAILGFSESLVLLPRDKAIEKMNDYARNIHEVGSGLLAIVGDILDIARVEAGALEVRQETGDLSAMLEDTLRLLKPLADEKDITLENHADQPCLALCDRRLTMQALINGVSNAIKNSPRGGKVSCGTHMAGVYAVVTVEDSGKGIGDDEVARVFQAFWQEGNYSIAQNGGVGLGLSIAKSYVEAQKGHVELASASDGGTVFSLLLPSASDEPALAQSGRAADPAGS